MIEVRDLPRYRDPSAWRRWLGPVAFSIALRASWFDPHTPRPRARAGQPQGIFQNAAWDLIKHTWKRWRHVPESASKDGRQDKAP